MPSVFKSICRRFCFCC